MAGREFFKHSETCDQVGDAETIRQAVISGRLPAYIELDRATCTVHSRDGNFPAGGSNAFADWFDCTPPGVPPAIRDKDPLKGWFEQEYILVGWFRVERGSATQVARMAEGDEDRVRVIAEHSDGSTATFYPDQHTRFQDLWFRAADIDQLMANALTPAPQTDKPLDPRERATLLCIIGALAKHAGLDLSQPIKAGETIAAMMPDVKLSGRTIGEHLKAVREAMGSRKG